jgi:hypothetical protein
MKDRTDPLNASIGTSTPQRIGCFSLRYQSSPSIAARTAALTLLLAPSLDTT